MVAGIQELLVLILIVMAIILLPRMTAKGREKTPYSSAQRSGLQKLSGKLRLAIVLSILWPTITALYLTPWNNGWRAFIAAGVGPVLLIWGGLWIIAGYKKAERTKGKDMSRQHKGHFADKHPQDATIPEGLRQKVLSRCQDRSISCAKAHAIAQELNILPAEVGKAIDLLECHIRKCQLGLFGYSPLKKIVQPAGQISPTLEKDIKSQLSNGRLACLDTWQLAEKHSISRLECCSACEALNIKISPCQLGAF